MDEGSGIYALARVARVVRGERGGKTRPSFARIGRLKPAPPWLERYATLTAGGPVSARVAAILAATRIACFMLRGSARFFPAMSKAVP